MFLPGDGGDEYFDIEAAPEGDDLEPTPEEVAAVAAATADLAPEPEPEPAKQNVVMRATAPAIPLEMHAKSAAAGAPYPTEDPKDDHTIWSPTPGTIGCNAQGFRKIRKI